MSECGKGTSARCRQTKQQSGHDLYCLFSNKLDVETAFDIQVNGKRGPGRPKITWKQLTERGCREWKLSAIDPHDRDTWRSGMRSAMRAASQLPGRGPTVVDMAPVPAR